MSAQSSRGRPTRFTTRARVIAQRYLVPQGMREYHKRWWLRDLNAGVALAAVSIPTVMGYTAITHTPLITGLYTLMLPLLAFALLGSSRLLVVGGDSATAGVLAAGLFAVGLNPNGTGAGRWLMLCSLTALLTAAMLLLARIVRLGFIGDFLSVSALLGFFAGVGILVATDQIPSLLGLPAGIGTWVQRQAAWLTHLDQVSWLTLGYGTAAVIIVAVTLQLFPKVPGALIAVVGLLLIATLTDAPASGVPTVGPVVGGLPQLSLPWPITWDDLAVVWLPALFCFFLVIGQSSATARTVALRGGEHANINRDLVGLSAANFFAAVSGTFVVNGSPTQTRVLKDSGGRTQLANLVVVVIVALVVLFLGGMLSPLPLSVLAGVVIVIGLRLIDVRGLIHIAQRRWFEAALAVATAAAVVLLGVGEAIVFAIIVSLLELVIRQYTTSTMVVLLREGGGYDYATAASAAQTRPGLIAIRFSGDLFFANASSFTRQVEQAVDGAPDPVRWVIVDCSGISDIDITGGNALHDVIAYLHARGIRVILARAEPRLLDTLKRYELLDEITPEHIYPDLDRAIEAFTNYQNEQDQGISG